MSIENASDRIIRNWKLDVRTDSLVLLGVALEEVSDQVSGITKPRVTPANKGV